MGIMSFGGVTYISRRGLRAALGALVLLAALGHGAIAQVADTERPLEGESYTAAEEAYKAFSQGDYGAAADRAARSVALRPDILRLRLLLIDSLIAAGNFTQADQVTVAALIVFAANQDLESRQASIRQRLAQQPAGDGYKALERGDTKAAIRLAKSAVESAPDVMSYRLLLLSAQIADNSLADAIVTSTEASKLDPGNYVPLVWRAYVYQRQGNRARAIADFNAALAIPGLTDTEKKNVSLIAADAALASGDYASAQELLQGYSNTDPAVVTRLNDAQAAASHKGTLKGDAKSMPMPVQNCRDTPYGSVCGLEPPLVQSILTPIDKASEGYEAADKAYRAAREKNYKLAIEEARKAIEDSPEVSANRLLLVNLLISSGRLAEAEAEASRLIQQGDAGGDIYVLRGNTRNQRHNYQGAMTDWETALKRGLAPDQSRNVRLSLADTALTAKEPLRALRALQNIPVSYDSAIRRAYAFLALDKKEEALKAFKVADRLASPGQQHDGTLRAQINLLLELGNKTAARALFDEAMTRGQLRSIREADLGYLAVAVGNDKLAMQLFDKAAASGQLPPRATVDAGYTAMRTFDNKKAIAYFKEGIDLQATGAFSLDDQKLFEVRRTVADLSREWGVNASVSYGKVGSAPNPFLIGGLPSTYTSQLGSELYYRPEEFGNRNGALFEVFGRVFETLYDQSGGPIGLPTTQGMVGARWKPLSDQNLVLEVDKLFALGDAARDDTLLRAAYSYSVGTDLRAVDARWPTWYVYSEVDRFLEHPQLVGIMEARFGESFKLQPISSNLVFFPHVVLAASYDDSFANPQAYSAGVGGSLRYWFGQTKYQAPPSYLELTLQYRFRLAGDKRAEGIFAQTSLNY
jgi:tetratricopeptide (TPR) repeat protein